MKSIRWILASLAVLALVGCASSGGGGGMSDEEIIQGMVDGAMAALKAKDIDSLVAGYADDFTSDNGDKAATTQFLEGAAEQGFLDDMTIDQSNMEIDVDGDTATVGPVALEGMFGAINLSFDLEKRDGRWLIVSQSQQM